MRWSYSKLSSYRQCPAKVRFKNEGHKSPTGVAAQRGLDAHAVMERYIKGESDECIPFYKSFLDNLRASGAQAELKVAVDPLWQQTDWDTAWGVGILDAAVIKPSVLSIFDWKTGKQYDDHVKQSDTYAALVPSILPDYEKISVSFVYVDLNKTSTWEYDNTKVSNIRQELGLEIARMEADTDMIPMPSMACRWCAFSKSKGGPCLF